MVGAVGHTPRPGKRRRDSSRRAALLKHNLELESPSDSASHVKDGNVYSEARLTQVLCPNLLPVALWCLHNEAQSYMVTLFLAP